MTLKHALSPQSSVVTGPYSPALVVEKFVFVSGQGPISPQNKQVASECFEEQLDLAFTNVQKVLEAASCTLDDCVKVTAYLSDMANYNRFNEFYKTKFSEPYPARTTVQVGLWNHIQVELDVVAINGFGQKD